MPTYTPPPDFVGGPNDFRAASTVTLTCEVDGATGAETYLWTSTCTGPGSSCFIYTGSGASKITQAISRTTVRSSDSGSHTCTATRTTPSEASGTATFEMNVIGGCAHLYLYQQLRHVHMNRSDWSCQILSTGSHQFEHPNTPRLFRPAM